MQRSVRLEAEVMKQYPLAETCQKYCNEMFGWNATESTTFDWGYLLLDEALMSYMHILQGGKKSF